MAGVIGLVAAKSLLDHRSFRSPPCIHSRCLVVPSALANPGTMVVRQPESVILEEGKGNEAS